jgi:hypothetical protein
LDRGAGQIDFHQSVLQRAGAQFDAAGRDVFAVMGKMHTGPGAQRGAREAPETGQERPAEF